MSLLFNMWPRFVIALLPRNKPLFIPWLQSPCSVILEPKKIKSVTVSIVSPFYSGLNVEKRDHGSSNLVYHLCSLEKEISPHSSILAWEIPWTEKPGRL